MGRRFQSSTRAQRGLGGEMPWWRLGRRDSGTIPSPPGDGGFLEAPSVARRLAVGSFVFRSPGEAPEKEGTRAGGHWDWWQLVEKSN